MADGDNITVAAPASMSSAHGTKAVVGADDEDGLDNGRANEVGGVAWLTETA